MKKLRASREEKSEFLNEIIEKLIKHNKYPIEEFSIENLKKKFTEVPKDTAKPTVKVTASAYVKMIEMVMQSPIECSWHGLVHRDKENNTYIIYDILIFPQINTPTTTTTDEKEFAEWQTNLIMDPNFPIEEMRMHGHSHVNMNVFSSGTDDTYQKDLIAKVDDGDYYIFFIMNKKLEIFKLLYDFDKQILFENNDINIEIIDESGNDIRKWIKEELDEKAKKPAVKYTPVKSAKGFGLDAEWEDESYFNTVKPIFNTNKGVSYGLK